MSGSPLLGFPPPYVVGLQLTTAASSRALLHRRGFSLTVLDGVMWIFNGEPHLPMAWSQDGASWAPAPDSMQNTTLLLRSGVAVLVRTASCHFLMTTGACAAAVSLAPS